MDKKQWHPAFCGATEWELKDNKDDLIFDREHNLSKKPLQVDMLVIKKESDADIKNEIGKIFRKHNIIEFKGEGDSLSIDDFYKGIGYGCIYKSLGKHVNEIDGNEITITFIRHTYPRELFGVFSNTGLEVDEKYHGIYYINGETLFPAQIIVTADLDKSKHPSLRILTNNADEEDIRRFLTEARLATEQGDLHNIDAVLQVSASANDSTYRRLRGDDKMCEALRELMKDEIEKDVAEGRLKENRETNLTAIKNLMKNLKWSAEQAMDAIGISPDARSMYMNML